jgi:hypothetical protein
MEKTKLGISVGLLGALVFFAGYSGLTVLALVGGYVLLKEENSTLKKYVVYAAALMIAFLAASMCITAIETVFDFLNFNSWMTSVDGLSTVYRIIMALFETLTDILYIAEILVFGFLALMALAGKEIKIAFLDKIVEKHM